VVLVAHWPPRQTCSGAGEARYLAAEAWRGAPASRGARRSGVRRAHRRRMPALGADGDRVARRRAPGGRRSAPSPDPARRRSSGRRAGSGPAPGDGTFGAPWAGSADGWARRRLAGRAGSCLAAGRRGSAGCRLRQPAGQCGRVLKTAMRSGRRRVGRGRVMGGSHKNARCRLTIEAREHSAGSSIRRADLTGIGRGPRIRNRGHRYKDVGERPSR